jgi:hypothetical protein
VTQRAVHVPVAFSLHVQFVHASMLHVPELLQSSVQSPPAHVRFTVPEPLFETLHSPSGQSKLHVPGPAHANVQPLPVHV